MRRGWLKSATTNTSMQFLLDDFNILSQNLLGMVFCIGFANFWNSAYPHTDRENLNAKCDFC